MNLVSLVNATQEKEMEIGEELGLMVAIIAASRVAREKHTRARSQAIASDYQLLPYAQTTPSPLTTIQREEMHTTRVQTSSSPTSSSATSSTSTASSRRPSGIPTFGGRLPRATTDDPLIPSGNPSSQQPLTTSTPRLSSQSTSASLFGRTPSPIGEELSMEMREASRNPARHAWRQHSSASRRNPGDAEEQKESELFSTPSASQSPHARLMSTTPSGLPPALPTSSDTPRVPTRSSSQSTVRQSISQTEEESLTSESSRHTSEAEQQFIEIMEETFRDSMPNEQESSNTFLHEFHVQLRELYVLDWFRKRDLDKYSTTLIPEQPIVVENGIVYHEDFPAITLNTMSSEPTKKEREFYPSVTNVWVDSWTGGSPPDPNDPGGNGSDDDQEPRRSPPRDSRPTRGHRDRGQRRSQTPDRHYPSGSRGGGGGPPLGPPGGGGGDDGYSGDDSYPSSGAEYDRYPNRKSTEPLVSRPSVFDQTRFTSADRTFNEKEEFTYDPKPLSEEEILRAAFKCYEDLIRFHLFGKPTKGNQNVQKTIIQNVPKPQFWYGDRDFTKWDEWIRSLILWLNIADQCGKPICWSRSQGRYVLSPVDIQRINTMTAFAEGDALDWLYDQLDQIPEQEMLDGTDPVHKTFMELVSRLYRRFIHEASMSGISDKFYRIRYTQNGGIKSAFSELKRYSKYMPSPLDVYTFKTQLFLLVPQNMEDDMRNIHRVTAEGSSVNEIMQVALACEKGHNAGKYYTKLREERKRAKHKESHSRSRDHKKGKEKDKWNKSRSPSPRCLQVVNNRRYSVKPNSDKRLPRPNWPRRVDNYKKDNRQPSGSYNKEQICSKSTGDNKPTGKFFKIVETKGKSGECLFQMLNYSDEEEQSQSSDKDNEPNESENNDSHSEDEAKSDGSTESDLWGGSQYSSDVADERTGFMHDESDNDSPYECLACSQEVSDNPEDTNTVAESVLQLDYGEYLCTMKLDGAGNPIPTLNPTSLEPHKLL
ncbi:hypothetical protein L218DRAFT_1008945 [Marasmius fiardii PR-910]|nr:hypothetical protein L218DRAFT_1008945 [Marasmius fiardii PR-910]